MAELLNRGHDVTVLVRDPARLGAVADEVNVVNGSSTDRTAMTELVTDCDAVVSALGPTKEQPDLHTRTAGLLVELLPKGARFVGISGAGIDVLGDQKGFRDKVISFLIMKLGGDVVKDKPREYEVFAGSDRIGRWCGHRGCSTGPPPGKSRMTRRNRGNRVRSGAQI